MRTLKLPKTKAAVAAADAAQAAFMAALPCETFRESWCLLRAAERADEAVGAAFAEETADRNNLATAKLVHPKDPWLRRMVEKYG